jgi:hypothetical protein
MLLLVVASFDSPCIERSLAQPTSNTTVAPIDPPIVVADSGLSNSTSHTAGNSEPVGSRYIIAIASLLLWVGTLQVPNGVPDQPGRHCVLLVGGGWLVQQRQ